MTDPFFDINPILQGLHACTALQSLSLEEKEALATQATLRDYAVDEEVFSMEQPGDAFYIVRSGKLFLRLRNRDKKVYEPGAIFGEVAIFDDRTRTGSVKVMEPAQLIRFERDLLFQESGFPASLQLKLIKLLTRHMIGYFYKEMPKSAHELIGKGESETVEFKKSADELQRPKIAETIVAMINAKGGTILLGVEDDGRVVGIKQSRTYKDVLALSLEKLVKQYIGQVSLTLFHVESEVVQNKPILRIDCDAAVTPLIWKEKKGTVLEEVLLVRTNNENTRIRALSDCVHYMEKRCKGQNKEAK